MRISAKVDYAVRAAVQLAAAEGSGPVKGDEIAAAQDIPINFLENILSLLRNAGFVMSRRGADGGYWLAVPADRNTIADIVRHELPGVVGEWTTRDGAWDSPPLFSD